MIQNYLKGNKIDTILYNPLHVLYVVQEWYQENELKSTCW